MKEAPKSAKQPEPRHEQHADPSRHWTWVDRCAVALVIVVILALVLAWVPGWPAIGAALGSDDAPAWAQALVGTAAIIAGACAIWWQVAEQDRQRKKDVCADEVRRLQLLGTAIFQCRATVVQLRRNSSSASPISNDIERLRAEVAMFDRIGFFDLPDPTAAFAVATVLNSFRENQAAICAPLEVAQPRVHLKRDEHLNALELNLEFAQKEVRIGLVRRGSDLRISLRTNDDAVMSSAVPLN